MSDQRQRGFTLLEMVCVLAIVALLSSVALPFVPRQTSRPRLQAYALQAVTLLKSDRAASMRSGARIDTRIDISRRLIRAGSGAALQLPDDVAFQATLPRSCQHRPVQAAISFFPDGLSCGGALTLSRADLSLEIRVNWLTGRIDIVPRGPAHG
ncbi:general secretion pathway protein GspH [Bradyrhizobium sp. SSBR45G]|uniref:prepilin-type N-terminal cleavage/methylation domain-containing protein n=1 Tax=unclassified Bradyrhizobium TaxID=2631580 RepID=UPI002342B060|nr:MULTISPECIES: prepilin-type N-terminal cleavage/methylation domain-containing protein [unclassified Bradyrhizobium]GLH76053.1 general secretion pathway protein GspH [Bradyrhizobium sp. SSBR45G]GLH83463.1 general secretion pathway protein GspH [Bradyrhizobium sp. SSBR45R]